MNKSQLDAVIGIVAGDAQAAQDAADAAALSETNAGISATAAANLYDAFDDRYLGAKAVDPTLDNDGNALLTGALYWNTTIPEMRAYSGSAWIGINAFQLPTQTGNAGKFLSTDGSNPSWVAPSGMKLLSEQIASNVASVTFASGIDSTYDEYEIHLYDVKPVTDNVTLNMLTSADGSSFASGASTYKAAMVSRESSNTSVSGANENTAIVLAASQGNATNEYGVSGTVSLYQPSVAHYVKVGVRVVGTYLDGSLYMRNGFAERQAAAVVTAVRFSFSSGNIASGTFRLYGISRT